MPRIRTQHDEQAAEALGSAHDEKLAQQVEAEQAAAGEPAESFDPQVVVASLDDTAEGTEEDLLAPTASEGPRLESVNFAARGGRPRKFDSFGARQQIATALDRPRWHESITEPKAIKSAWAKVAQAAEAAQEAVAHVGTLDGERQREEAQYMGKVRAAAYRGDEPPERPAQRDWQHESAVRAATAHGRLQALREARAAYDAAVDQSGVAARLIDEGWPAALKAAQAAVQSAVEAVQRAVAVRNAAAAEVTKDGTRESVPQPAAWFKIVADLQRVRDVLDKAGSSPVSRPAMTPSWRERQAIAQSSEMRQLAYLARVEREEEYRLTDFTKYVKVPDPDAGTVARYGVV